MFCRSEEMRKCADHAHQTRLVFSAGANFRHFILISDFLLILGVCTLLRFLVLKKVHNAFISVFCMSATHGLAKVILSKLQCLRYYSALHFLN